MALGLSDKQKKIWDALKTPTGNWHLLYTGQLPEERAKLDKKILKMLNKGFTWKKIQQTLDVSHHRVYRVSQESKKRAKEAEMKIDEC